MPEKALQAKNIYNMISKAAIKFFNLFISSVCFAPYEGGYSGFYLNNCKQILSFLSMIFMGNFKAVSAPL
jgi:hypothetical protein